MVGPTNGPGQKTLYEAIGSPTKLPTPEVQGVDSLPPSLGIANWQDSAN